MPILRLASFAVNPGAPPELVRVYAADCAPLVRAEPGNLDCFLLEPLAAGDLVIACTIWESETAAAAYDASGRGAAIAGRVSHLFGGPPTLRTYRRA